MALTSVFKDTNVKRYSDHAKTVIPFWHANYSVWKTVSRLVYNVHSSITVTDDKRQLYHLQPSYLLVSYLSKRRYNVAHKISGTSGMITQCGKINMHQPSVPKHDYGKIVDATLN